jgi:hypothetical protein
LVKKRLENAAMLAPTLQSVKRYLKLIFNHEDTKNTKATFCSVFFVSFVSLW